MVLYQAAGKNAQPEQIIEYIYLTIIHQLPQSQCDVIVSTLTLAALTRAITV